MADSLDEFRRKNAAQFVRAKAALQALAREYIYCLADDVIHRTPGFGGAGYAGQEGRLPYTPTGRLRGGWNWTLTPIRESTKGWNVARGEDGPFSDYGVETLARIRSQLDAMPMGGISYLENDVSYAADIVWARRNHSKIRARPFNYETAREQKAIFQVALANFKAAP